LRSVAEPVLSIADLFLSAIPEVLQVGGNGGVQLRGFCMLLAQLCNESLHFLLEGSLSASYIRILLKNNN
jgi:hypothetical protein